MGLSRVVVLSLILVLFYGLCFNCRVVSGDGSSPQEFIKTQCKQSAGSNSDQCVKDLSPFAGDIKNSEKRLALRAVVVSQKTTKSIISDVKKYASNNKKNPDTKTVGDLCTKKLAQSVQLLGQAKDKVQNVEEGEGGKDANTVKGFLQDAMKAQKYCLQSLHGDWGGLDKKLDSAADGTQNALGLVNAFFQTNNKGSDSKGKGKDKDDDDDSSSSKNKGKGKDDSSSSKNKDKGKGKGKDKDDDSSSSKNKGKGKDNDDDDDSSSPSKNKDKGKDKGNASSPSKDKDKGKGDGDVQSKPKQKGNDAPTPSKDKGSGNVPSKPKPKGNGGDDDDHAPSSPKDKSKPSSKDVPSKSKQESNSDTISVPVNKIPNAAASSSQGKTSTDDPNASPTDFIVSKCQQLAGPDSALCIQDLKQYASGIKKDIGLLSLRSLALTQDRAQAVVNSMSKVTQDPNTKSVCSTKFADVVEKLGWTVDNCEAINNGVSAESRIQSVQGWLEDAVSAEKACYDASSGMDSNVRNMIQEAIRGTSMTLQLVKAFFQSKCPNGQNNPVP